jgi:hypothetical protein
VHQRERTYPRVVWGDGDVTLIAAGLGVSLRHSGKPRQSRHTGGLATLPLDQQRPRRQRLGGRDGCAEAA